jgi:transcriptional regulator of NAD metabolism
MSIEKLLIQILTNQSEIKQELKNINERLDRVENTIRKHDKFTQTPTEQKVSRLLQWMRDNKLDEVTQGTPGIT